MTESSNCKVILFGAGKDGLAALRTLGNDSVECFCDNNKANDVIEGIEVISYESLKEKYNDKLILITSTNYKSVFEISQMLERGGFCYDLFENYMADYIRQEGDLYNSLNSRSNFIYEKSYEYLFTLDKCKDAGALGSYFYQDLWAAKHIFERKPQEHFDIGSRIDGFIGHLLSFGQNVKQIDIRPMESVIPGWGFVQGDATNLETIPDDSIDSISALCSLEHFGLGRYGDKIDPDACFQCFGAIQRKMCVGGEAYISVPIGKEHLEFNAHRIFYPQTIIDAFDKLKLVEFSVTREDIFIENADIHKYDDDCNRNGKLFGLFRFQKIN